MHVVYFSTLKTFYKGPMFFNVQDSVRRVAVGIWKCKSTNKKIAGGAYQLATSAAVTAKTTINRLRRLREIGGD